MTRLHLELIAVLLFVRVPILGADDAPDEPPVTSSDREHWAYMPVQDPPIPEVTGRSWCRTPVDRFILAELEERGLTSLPEADRRTLLRRVTFDLTGLPPSVADIESFLDDEQPGAYERVVDRLLASPAYGERWGQHWLDLARFAETDGFEHDKVRPNAWRFRDWVIDVLNEDLPYDQFVRLQLAGDELAPDDPQAAIATGFLLTGPDMPDINLQEERRHNFLNDMTATVGAVFLGLQMQCASCHDHKYDAISQYDFYRLRAFFDPAEIFGEHQIPTREERVQTREFERERAVRWQSLEAQIKTLRDDESPTAAKRIEALEKELAALKKADAPPVSMGRVVRNPRKPANPSRFWIRGDFRRPGPKVDPGFIRVANHANRTFSRSIESSDSRGVRTALADWLVSPDQPLTTRVIVNRLWQHLFGRGLVGTSSDFGVMGEWPTHPELHDWLCTEFTRQGWSMKSFQRMLVTSSTYRTSSRPAGEAVDSTGTAWARLIDLDSRNDWLGRMRRKRLDGEAIRDAMLTSAGQLNRESGGPGIRPPLAPEVTSTLLTNQWPVTKDEAAHRRRSVYLFVRRNLPYPLFAVFDRPDTNQSCPIRNETTIAPQALHLLNSEFSLTCAERLADRLRRECGADVTLQINRGYQLTLGRPPGTDELGIAHQFLADGSPSSLVDFCLALFNLNEFVYVD
jgi:hypothetical protein